MFTTFRRVLYIHLFLCTAVVVIAQMPEDEIIMTGRLVEYGSGDPLPFATVAVYADADSSMSGNALTAENGRFNVSLSPGRYHVKISFIGFRDKTLPDIEVSTMLDTLDVGKVTMVSEAVALEEVEVTAERSTMELELDRRVFNVGKDLANAGNSAADILDRVPSVTVDPEGNVSLRGSQGVRILVNGKPSGLMSAGDTEALLQMQGDIIETVEVITNPSARYEAEGEAGIINIIFKKNTDTGVNGSFSGDIGYPANYGASYNLNFHRDKINFFSNFGIDYRSSPGGGSSSQRFFDNGELTEFYTTKTDRTRQGLGGYLQMGADWNIDEHHVITGSLLYQRGEDKNDQMITYRDFDESDNLVSTSIRNIDETEDEHDFETSLFYKRTFDTPDREWTIDAKYILDDETELADYVEESDDSPEPLIQRSSNTEDEVNALFQTDYIHPIGESSKFELGLRATFRTVNNDFFVKEENDEGEFITLPDFDDYLKYSEDIYAAYVIGSHEFGDLAVQIGLRAELSDIDAALLDSEVTNTQNYFNLFPSASTSYQFSEKDQLQLSYSRRLSRPRFRLLLPFSNFNDPRSNYQGNPNLRPEFTNVFEIGHLHYFTSGSLLSSVYYRRTTGVIDRLTLPTGEGTTIRYPVNLSVRNSYGLEFSFSYDLTDWWVVNSDLNFFRSLVDGEYEGQVFSNDAYSLGGRITTKLDIGDDAKMQFSYDYDAPRNTTQGRRLSRSDFDISGSLDVLQGNGTMTLSVRDVFNSRQRRSIIDQPDYQAESNFRWRRGPSVVLGFTYRLNSEKEENGGDYDEFEGEEE